MIELDAFTALRRGELIGLRWQDVDFENLILQIRRSVVAMVEGAPKNGSFDERRSARYANGRVAVDMETPFSVPKSGRLGTCFAAHEKPTALSAWNVVAILWQAGFAACQSDEAGFVSHLSIHFWDALERERRESQGRTGTAAPRESESHHRRLHAGSRSTEARSTSNMVKLVRRGAVLEIKPA